MEVRFRSFGALVVLLAFTASFAEGVWASMCPPQMDMSGVEADSGNELTPSCGMLADGHENDDAAPPEPGHSDAPVCPFGPVGGVCVPTSLPASGASMALPIPDTAPPTRDGDVGLDILLTAVLFHPPKA